MADQALSVSDKMYNLVDFGIAAIPVHRIVALEKDGDGGVEVRAVDGDGDYMTFTVDGLKYEEAVKRYRAAVNQTAY